MSGNQVQISDSAGSCEAGQTATVKASDGSGLLTLSSVGESIGSCQTEENIHQWLKTKSKTCMLIA